MLQNFQKNKLKIILAITILILLSLWAGSIAYLYVNKESVNIFGKNFGFEKQTTQTTAPKDTSICGKFDLEDKLQDLKQPDLNNLKNTNTYQIMVLLVGLQQSDSSIFQTSKYSSFLTLALSSVWIGDGSNYPIESYQAVRAPFVGLYNLPLSKLETLSKKEFLQSLDCSIIKANDTQIIEKSNQKWAEKFGSSYQSTDSSKYTFFDKKINQDRIDKAETASDTELDQMILAKSQDYDKYIHAGSPAGSKSPTDNYFQKLYEEVPFLVKDGKYLQEVGADNFSKNLILQKQEQENAKLTEYQKSVKMIPFNSTFYSLGGGGLNKIYSLDSQNYLFLGAQMLSGGSQTHLSLHNINQNKDTIVWILPDTYENHKLYDISNSILSTDKSKIYLVVRYEDDSSPKNTNWFDYVFAINTKTGKIEEKYKVNSQTNNQLPKITSEGRMYTMIDSTTIMVGSPIMGFPEMDFSDKIIDLKTGKTIINLDSDWLKNYKVADYILSSDSKNIFICVVADKIGYKCRLYDLSSGKVIWEKAANGSALLINFENSNLLRMFVNTKNQYAENFDLLFSFDLTKKSEINLDQNLEYYLALQNLQGYNGTSNINSKYIATFNKNGVNLERSTVNIYQMEDKKLTLKKQLVLPKKNELFADGYSFSQDGSSLVLVSSSTDGKNFIHIFDLNQLK